MKKVLVVINTLGHAGAEAALLELLRRLDPDKYEVFLYVLMGQGEMVHELPEHVKLLNRHYSDTSVLSREGKGHMIGQVLKAMVRRGTLIRLLPYLAKNLYVMAGKGQIMADKLLWRVLSDGGQRLSGHYALAVAYLEGGSAYYVADHVDADKKAAFLHVDYSRAGYTRALDRDCYPGYDKIFTVSGEVKDSFLKIYPECREKTEVFHNLIDQEKIRRKSMEPGGFEDDYKGVRLLSVGRLTDQKAYPVSIEAMKLLKEKGVQARWYVLGEGNQRSLLEEKIRALGLEKDFLLLGDKKNPYPYMAQADIYVHASRFEGKSIAIQEAQTLGCAMVVSDCSGNREQVVNGEDGILCKLQPEAVCDGILKLIRDEGKRKRLGQAASEKKLTDEEEINKLLSLIE